MGTNTLLEDLRRQAAKKKLPPLISRTFKTMSDDGGSCVRIFQWNILAQALSEGADNFILCPAEALHWHNRHLHIMEELLTYNATILCLEEVDKFEFLKERLHLVGFKGIFLPKPDSPCLYSKNSSGPDGCAIFWKANDVEVIKHKNVTLEDQYGLTNQVAIICRFKKHNGGKEFYVAVTHLKAKEGYEEVRHQQSQHLEKTLIATVGSSPLVLCGDFNAEVTEGAYQLFQKSKLGLVSSYSQLSPDGSEIPYTTWKVRGNSSGNQEHSRTIDYVWFSRDKLTLKALLMMPSAEEIGKDRLPSHSYPSDHLSLVCDFILK